MESMQYDRFSSSESENSQRCRNEFPAYTPNQQNRRIYIMIGVLAVFLLLLTLSMGIKITQVNQQVSDLVSSLQTYSTSKKAAQTALISPVDSRPTEMLPVRGSCEEDWVFYKNKCYYTSTQGRNWHDAEKDCNLRRGHLLVVNNQEEMVYISQVVEEHQSYWIGLIEKEGEGKWSWVDGTDFESTEHFWDNGQPDDWHQRMNGEDCGQIHQHNIFVTTHRLWNDADCTLSYRYVCERPA
ncbi:hepatic lectin-like [Tachysurus ichikawai]